MMFRAREFIQVSSKAAAGEILISEDNVKFGNLNVEGADPFARVEGRESTSFGASDEGLKSKSLLMKN
jgi:hypothetical protein